MRLQAQSVLLGHRLQRLHLCLQPVELDDLLLLDLGRLGLLLPQFAQSIIQIRQAAGAVVDLFDRVWLVILLGELIQSVLTLGLVGMEVLPELRLPGDLGLCVLQLLLQIDQIIRVADLLEASFQLRMLAHEIGNCLVGVHNFLLGGLDS